ncbi:MAG: hypothetical protein SangKO_051230 [Sandaracinaceae bacterium]
MSPDRQVAFASHAGSHTGAVSPSVSTLASGDVTTLGPQPTAATDTAKKNAKCVARGGDTEQAIIGSCDMMVSQGFSSPATRIAAVSHLATRRG